jgi:hypothetical protein
MVILDPSLLLDRRVGGDLLDEVDATQARAAAVHDVPSLWTDTVTSNASGLHYVFVMIPLRHSVMLIDLDPQDSDPLLR